ncbi:hypothetical protein NQ317_006205 [Molorchus minor]|uniref:asparagine--tRNA ligase n=1 Tax=Molorchus minor TaxID=1323400 RepID=A0ABQ9ITF9_9CUCU|nr:hypothetical protein NQ317_006205 [Molorchus minor]
MNDELFINTVQKYPAVWTHPTNKEISGSCRLLNFFKEMFKNIFLNRLRTRTFDLISYNSRNVVTGIENIHNNDIGKEVEFKGWVKSVRKHKENIFVDLSYGIVKDKVQILIPLKLNPQVSPGTSIAVKGRLHLSPRGQIELLAERIKVFGKCSMEEGYPFAPRKTYAPEYVRQYLHLRPRYNKFSSLLKVRSAAELVIHEYFNSEGYISVHTPILTSNDCEGAGEIFKVIPDNEALLTDMVREKVPLHEAFFNTKVFLSVSGQLHLEAAAHSLHKVYTFGPTFRAENSKTRLHLSEFYMVESEIAFLEKLEELIQIIEELIKSVTKSLLNRCEDDIQLFCTENKISFTWLDKNFPILTYSEAIGILKSNRENFKTDIDYNKGFSKEHEIFLVNYCGGSPTFIINWPKVMKPFYMKECEDEDTEVAALDLLAPGVGEIVGGSLRENNYIKLKNRLPKLSEQLEWYLDLRKYGGVPTGGFGLGFERYLLFLLGINNIKDTIPFPRWPHNCSL